MNQWLFDSNALSWEGFDMNRLLVFTFLMIGLVDDAAVRSQDGPSHLFILSGQSNMQGLRPKESFIPSVEQAFGKGKCIVVFDAMGGQPIRRWHKNWQSPSEKGSTESTPTPNQKEKPKSVSPTNGDLYDRLMAKVKAAVKDRELASVTFIWMQGERDAREKNASVYAASLKGVVDQLAADLNRQDINLVIGRLSDFDLENKRYPHWTLIRKVQVAFVEMHPRAKWVNTDDLNDGLNRKGKTIKNDLHYSAEGYKILGTRFANAAVQLIKTE